MVMLFQPPSMATELMFTYTIKSLSDFSVPATVILIGVADSVDQLIDEHPSVERPLVQVPMPRMSIDECKQIVVNGLPRISMTIDEAGLDQIASISQGLPYITHLLSLHSAREALHAKRLHIEKADVDAGIKKALDQWQQSITRAYYDATMGHNVISLSDEAATILWVTSLA